MGGSSQHQDLKADDREAAYTRHWASSQDRLRAYILQRMSNTGLVDDILQEVSVILWNKWDSFELGTNFLAWSKAVAHFKILRACYDAKHQPASVSPDLLDLMQPDAGPFDARIDERIHYLQGCLKELEDEDREIIRLRYEKGLEGKKIAEQMMKRANLMYKRIGAIRKQLHRCIIRRSHEINKN